jgi:hypothetical protein
MLTIAMLVAVCTACSSKKQVTTTSLVASCVGDAKYEQVKIRIEHDATNEPAKATVPVIPAVTVYMNSTDPAHKEKVCWVIEPVDHNGNASQLWTSLLLFSKDGTAAFEKWTKKQKMPGDPFYINSGKPIKEVPSPGWGYSLKYGGLDIDPVIIVIDDGR